MNNNSWKIVVLTASPVFHALFWVLIILVLYIGGQYGNGAPRPLGWELLDEIEMLALFSLAASSFFGIYGWKKFKIFSISGLVSFSLLLFKAILIL